MNDPNKAIDVNLSSLLSLKAELLRKQAEVNKTKSIRPATTEYSSNKANNSNLNEIKAAKKDKSVSVKEIEKTKDTKIYEHDDSMLLEKSRRVLEAKSKFYERMSRTGGKLNSDDNCLVLFNRKQQENRFGVSENNEKFNVSSDSDSDSSSKSDKSNNDRYPTADRDDDDEDWVEYTDCLGRTRKCLRKDLESAKKRDAELAASMPERIDQNKANWMPDGKTTNHSDDEKDADDTPFGPLPTESIYSDGCSLISKLDEQRANWERKEIENLDKKDVHYQDVFFDEARQHGVAYYAFSTDEEERRKQQKELADARERTLAEQKQRDAMRAQREKIIAERVLAAKNRQRARLGLPPLEKDEPTQEKPNESETKEERKARKRAEKLKRKQEKLDLEREKERAEHVRPWDVSKDGVRKSNDKEHIETEWQYKPEREPLSQEEWNERKRAERNPEFAPIPDSSHTKLKRTNFTSVPPPPPEPPQFSKNTHYMDTFNMPPPPSTFNNFSTFQSTKKHFQRRNYQSPPSDDIADASRQGVCIAPPVDLDYSTPAASKKPKSSIELEHSIEAGLRFLRNHCDKSANTSKSSWTAKADY